MNIRLHVLSAIRSGLPAQITVQATVPGVLFADEKAFIPFADLNYNAALGYYRLSQFPDEMRECENANPETIHRYGVVDDWQAYVWLDADGYPHQLGELHQIADLYAALGALLLRDELSPEPVDEFDPAWGQNFDIADAVREAIAYGYVDEGAAARVADTIRAAARAGRIRGATQRNGAWRLPKLTFRSWLVKSSEEKRGRPRKEPA